jgi:hypothetical protein
LNSWYFGLFLSAPPNSSVMDFNFQGLFRTANISCRTFSFSTGSVIQSKEFSLSAMFGFLFKIDFGKVDFIFWIFLLIILVF